MAILDFNAADVEPADNDFTPLPVGDYKMAVTNTEIKETKSNAQNKYLSVTLEVLEGNYKGRLVFENLNLWRAGTSEKDRITVKIAQQKLSGICRAVGNLKIKDTSELHNKPIIATLKIRPASGDYGERNEVAKYRSINGGNTLPTSTPAQTEEKPPAMKPPAMPWD